MEYYSEIIIMLHSNYKLLAMTYIKVWEMVITATGSFVKYVDINKDHRVYLETFISNGCLKMAMKCYSNLYHNN